MSELIEQLRKREVMDDRTGVLLPVPDALCLSAADEIERLRGLITAWADADLLVTPYGPSIHPIIDAENALRKAVGR